MINLKNPRATLKDPDLVDRIFEYICSEPALAAALSSLKENENESMDAFKKAVRSEFQGETIYIATRRPVAHLILEMFNGRNAREVARRLNISRATVYRHLKQPGQASKVS